VSGYEMAGSLGPLDLFHGLAPAAMNALAESGRIAEYEPGEEVLVAGHPVAGAGAPPPGAVEMHVVLDGAALVRGRRGLIAELGPGAYFGELSLIDGRPRSATVIASAEGLTTFALPKAAFDRVLEEHPQVAVPMLRVLCARLRRYESDEE
jgi:CRP/FNR family cyclic AMP-dependent transcriptional regulator